MLVHSFQNTASIGSRRSNQHIEREISAISRGRRKYKWMMMVCTLLLLSIFMNERTRGVWRNKRSRQASRPFESSHPVCVCLEEKSKIQRSNTLSSTTATPAASGGITTVSKSVGAASLVNRREAIK